VFKEEYERAVEVLSNITTSQLKEDPLTLAYLGEK